MVILHVEFLPSGTRSPFRNTLDRQVVYSWIEMLEQRLRDVQCPIHEVEPVIRFYGSTYDTLHCHVEACCLVLLDLIHSQLPDEDSKTDVQLLRDLLDR